MAGGRKSVASGRLSSVVGPPRRELPSLLHPSLLVSPSAPLPLISSSPGRGQVTQDLNVAPT